MSRRPPVAATGIRGFDEILCGGIPRDHLYLIEGDPGVGKTTLALQFLLAGRDAGEKVLYITLSETAAEIHEIAASHGWSLEGVSLFELSALEQQLRLDAETTMFHPAEVQLTAITQTLLARVAELDPSRVVFDSLSELRLLAQSALRYRREVLGLKQYFANRQCTVFLLDDRTSGPGELQVQSLAHGVVSLESRAPEIGADRRRLRITKLRGVKFAGGYHDYVIVVGGVDVFPRLVASEHDDPFVRQTISSGVEALDQLLGGGLDRGTSTLITGPAGTGKSAVAAQYATAAVARGDRAVIFAFDELRATLIARTDALGMKMSEHLASGMLEIRQVDPAEMGAGEFVACVQRAVEAGVKVVVIDSINGLIHAMPEDRFLYMQLHELLSFLGRRGITTLLVMAQAGMMGAGMSAPADVSYIADTVILMRYFEAGGRVRKAVSVVKKRSGMHEDAIREFTMDRGGLRVGEPLAEFRGVLTGVPIYTGRDAQLTTR
ncbi:MAG: AAA family ATPase [Deltaproteobacteria bacterium]|nr:AAA family ATPase [Deltaproteobacteria bacterium]